MQGLLNTARFQGLEHRTPVLPIAASEYIVSKQGVCAKHSAVGRSGESCQMRRKGD